MASSLHSLYSLLLDVTMSAMISLAILTVANSSFCHAFTLNTAVMTVPPSKSFIYNKSLPRHELTLWMSSSATTPALVTATIQNRYDQLTSQEMVSQTLCPPKEERDRNTAGMEAYNNKQGGKAITNDDPRSEYTYGEFPFESFDVLVDRALDFVQPLDADEYTMVDLGSGCGRLVFYAALTRGKGTGEGSTEEEESRWNVHGVEIGTQLHSLAVNSLQRGVDNGWFEHCSGLVSEEQDGVSKDGMSRITFHNGNALLKPDPYYTNVQPSDNGSSSIQPLLSQTNLLFAYCTVWETDSTIPFDPELQAMILSPKWSQTLASLCPKGCVAITTDRALNPEDGWKLVDRMDVENPSVWGSVGYISVLEK